MINTEPAGYTAAVLLRLLRALRDALRRRWVMTRHRIKWLRDDVRVAPGSFVARDVVIGRGTLINAPSFLDPCEIGSYCAFAGRLVVRSGNHLTNLLVLENDLQQRLIGARSLLGPRELVRIGHGVWIGDSVVVCPGVTIGNGAVVGAGSVVTRDVPDYAVAAGNPARVLRYRFPDQVIEKLDGLEWWSWDREKMRRNRDLFELDLATIDPDHLEKLLAEVS